MQRYFVNQTLELNQVLTLNETDSFHIIKVMRLTIDQSIILCDNDKIALSQIIAINPKAVVVRVIKFIDEDNELPVKVTIAQGLIVKNKLEEVIEKLTQLGAYKYLPVNMQRCNIKINGDQFNNKISRYQTIIKEASEQSHRRKLLILNPIISFKQLLLQLSEYDLVLVAYENHQKNDNSFKKVLETKKYQSILVIIGPEGGFSDDEVAQLRNHATFISLGSRILRTEVAPLYALAAISYALELEK